MVDFNKKLAEYQAIRDREMEEILSGLSAPPGSLYAPSYSAPEQDPDTIERDDTVEAELAPPSTPRHLPEITKAELMGQRFGMKSQVEINDLGNTPAAQADMDAIAKDHDEYPDLNIAPQAPEPDALDAIIDAYDIDLGSPEMRLLAEVDCGAKPIECRFITGAAGTGKTTLVRQRIEQAPPGSIILAATTGIAAVNLGEGVTTIHSLLKFFDHASMQEAYLSGRLTRRFVDLSKDGVREIDIDEVSMLSGPMLDLMYQAASEASDYSKRIGLTLIGDHCQLPPIKAPYAFEARCWPAFVANTERLTKIYRQSDTRFLQALNHLRAGEGGPAAEILRAMGIQFHREMQDDFPGTTLRAKNDEVDRYNQLRLLALPGQQFNLKSSRWGTPEIYQPADTRNPKGRQPGDWKEIPDRLGMKIGARVMVLRNDTQGWTYVNGSTGTLVGLKKAEDGGTLLQLKLDNGNEVEIGKLIRRVESKRLPDEWEGQAERLKRHTRESAIAAREPFWMPGNGRRAGAWVRGEVEYFPVRLAWASTIHKSQGLTLDRVQIDMRAHFFGAPAMAYVSLSRCKSPEGLRLVGSMDDLAGKCNVDPKVRGWL
jgi:ATP-dependent DNA helicase PIF1